MKCRNCRIDKEDKEYYVRYNGKLDRMCKCCHREYRKEHYKNNKKAYKKKAKKNRELSTKKYREYVWDHLKNNPCVDCGESNILVLDFDHRDRSEKKHNISHLWDRGGKVLRDEIDKCDVRCANCHRIKTAKENNSWKYKKMKR